MTVTMDWTDALLLKAALVVLVLALPVALFAGAAYLVMLALMALMAWPGKRRAERERKAALQAKLEKARARDAFKASLPRTKSGGLFPLGKRQLAAYDEEHAS